MKHTFINHSPRSPTESSALPRRLLLGVAGAAAVAIVGTAGIAAAANGATPKPTSKADCAHFQDFGFKNRGQCVAWVEHNVLGHGYGGGNGGDNSAHDNQIDTTVNVHVTGHHNIIRLVLNFLFG